MNIINEVDNEKKVSRRREESGSRESHAIAHLTRTAGAASPSVRVFGCNVLGPGVVGRWG